ncbi:MAG: TonB box-like protein [Candidatus Yonathbacteria bacterium RIFCSPLOWO2_01_FULL_47_33b]|uniref:TonB box-like protein n=1 Tax=Candidatus Yonathbacteria bacterium RIFCSPLOWO2_01_FULL_47_33b TaxID=1802727 RepID=A0A1G2SE24_9BACT|nr:MAG: TonB box-like protein [Candidatus Yonathbacteria bacterium RIFCSPLOWO2_01_FULL_47_33b]
MRTIQPGIYEHHKGHQYRVLGVAEHSETLEKMVVYQALYGEKGLWVRPLAMFLEEVEVAGKKTPRFQFLGVNG